jgi:hypothetical protein
MGMSKIFRNRWAALFWAAGIVWTAYDVAEANAPPSHQTNAKPHAQPTDDTGATVSDDDEKLLASVIGAQ